jgi:hypothetical protein
MFDDRDIETIPPNATAGMDVVSVPVGLSAGLWPPK